jgi:ribosomal protein S15P/S13E
MVLDKFETLLGQKLSEFSKQMVRLFGEYYIYTSVKGLAPQLPEDLYHLIKKAVSVRRHLEKNRKDKDTKFRLILVESRVHRLARYYKRARVLPPTWKYDSATASALVSS